jgi:hypothetical protein
MGAPERWPRALLRFGYDFLPKSRAPENDGVLAPAVSNADWVRDLSSTPEALETARLSRVAAEDRAKTAEEKAARLLQTSLALLTLATAVGAFQLRFAFAHGSWAVTSLLPASLALACLALAAFEADAIDRVGIYREPRVEDLAVAAPEDVAVALLAAEVQGRDLAAWTANKKLSDLLQARAWFSRGLAALLSASVVAGVCSATDEPPPKTLPPPTTSSATAP